MLEPKQVCVALWDVINRSLLDYIRGRHCYFSLLSTAFQVAGIVNAIGEVAGVGMLRSHLVNGGIFHLFASALMY